MQAFLSTPLPLMPLVMKESMTPRESDTAVGQEPTRGSMDSEGDAQARPGLFAGTAAGTGGPRQRAGEGRALTSGDRGLMPQGCGHTKAGADLSAPSLQHARLGLTGRSWFPLCL